jgi:hypothetical protein
MIGSSTVISNVVHELVLSDVKMLHMRHTYIMIHMHLVIRHLIIKTCDLL